MRESTFYVSAVPGQQTVGMDGGMGADEEIGHHMLAWDEPSATKRTVNVLGTSTRRAEEGNWPLVKVLAPRLARQVEGLGA